MRRSVKLKTTCTYNQSAFTSSQHNETQNVFLPTYLHKSFPIAQRQIVLPCGDEIRQYTQKAANGVKQHKKTLRGPGLESRAVHTIHATHNTRISIAFEVAT